MGSRRRTRGRRLARTCQKRKRRGCHSVGSESNKDCKRGGEDLGGSSTPLPRPFVSFASHNLTRGRERKKARVERYNGHDLDGRKSIALFSLPSSVRPSVLLPDSSLFVRPLSLSLDRPSHAAFSCFLSLRQLFTRTELPKKISPTGFKIGGQGM